MELMKNGWSKAKLQAAAGWLADPKNASDGQKNVAKKSVGYVNSFCSNIKNDEREVLAVSNGVKLAKDGDAKDLLADLLGIPSQQKETKSSLTDAQQSASDEWIKLGNEMLRGGNPKKGDYSFGVHFKDKEWKAGTHGAMLTEAVLSFVAKHNRGVGEHSIKKLRNDAHALKLEKAEGTKAQRTAQRIADAIEGVPLASLKAVCAQVPDITAKPKRAAQAVKLLRESADMGEIVNTPRGQHSVLRDLKAAKKAAK